MLRKATIAWSTFCREGDQGGLYASQWFLRRFYYRFVKRVLDSVEQLPNRSSDAAPIDVVIPATEKDLPTLQLCVESAHEFVRPGIRCVYVVSTPSSAICEIASAMGCSYVEEDAFLPLPRRELRCSGWVVQQVVKFAAHRHVNTGNYLVLDADTLLVRPQAFLTGGRRVLKYSDQYELLYNPSLRLLLGTRKRFPVSFIAHHMLLSSAIVRELLDQLEREFGEPWYDTIVNRVDHSQPISLSEYELYGNYAMSTHRESHKLVYWLGMDLGRDYLESLGQLVERYGRRYRSLSFHHYLDPKKVQQ